jgi:hypothetical protein
VDLLANLLAIDAEIPSLHEQDPSEFYLHTSLKDCDKYARMLFP